MEFTCGTDIIEIQRIKESIESLGDKFLKRVYTKKEIEYCESKKAQKYQHYAARFAAKEAAFKAISKYIDDKYEVSWTDFEVVNDENGRPILKLFNESIEETKKEIVRKIKQMDLSLSHCKEYAVANVVVVGDVPNRSKIEQKGQTS